MSTEIKITPTKEITQEDISSGFRQSALPFIGKTRYEGGPEPFMEAAFIEAALLEGAHMQLPSNMTEKEWTRNLSIFSDYVTTTKPIDELESIHNTTSARISMIVKDTAHMLWLNCNPDIQEQFSPELMTGIRRRDQEIASLDFVTNYLALRPNHSPSKICGILGITSETYNNRRTFLIKHGFTIDDLFESQLREETDLEKAQDLLSQITRRDYLDSLNDENPAIIAIGNVVENLVYRPNLTREIAIRLMEQGIPVGELSREKIVKRIRVDGSVVKRPTTERYYFISSPFKEQARKVIQDMNIPRAIERLAGPEPEEGKWPKGSQLSDHEGYSGLRFVLRENLGLKRVPAKVFQILSKRSNELEFTVFKYRNAIYIQNDDIPAFIQFIAPFINLL